MILARQYSAAVPFVHTVNFYTLSVSYVRLGITKELVDRYLKKDGTRFTSTLGYQTMRWYKESIYLITIPYW